jgi:murein DD-endopeptidase MepM/ murein hydrolase activator NlpD
MSRGGKSVGGILAALVIVVLLAVSLLLTTVKFGIDTLIAAAGSASACGQSDQTAILAVDQVNFSGNPAGFKPDQVRVLNTGVGVAFAHKELAPAERLHLARILLSVGLVESEARNLRRGHETSLGWLQQQKWWGTVAQRTNVAISTELFISGGEVLSELFNGRPDTSEPGVFDIKGWQKMPAGEVAWRVQLPREDLRGKYAARLPEVDRFLAGKSPSVEDPNAERASTPSIDQASWTEDCTGIDPAGLGTKDGFTFPVAASQATIKKGVSYNGTSWVWCFNSLTNCHHDYKAADIHAPPGTSVVAAMAGVVIKAVNQTACSGSADLDVPRLTIRDPKTDLYYYYTHLMPGSVTVKAGDKVDAGQQIGKIGPAECAQNTGPHLHIHATRGPGGNTSDPVVRGRMVDLQPLLVGAFNQVGQAGSGDGSWMLPSKTIITSCYGMRFHPIDRVYRMHEGTDFGAPMGDPIVAASDGVVESARFRPVQGNAVLIRHNPKLFTRYQHLSRFEKGIRSGVSVDKGQIIGYSGSTGLSTGAHLHAVGMTDAAGNNTFNLEAFFVSKGVKLPQKTGRNC